MESPGKLLREVREERGLTLDDVAAMTRIPKSMVEHLENDRFEEYVADVFVRGHIRNYARELRIDAEKVLQCYEHHTGRRRQNSASGPEGQRQQRTPRGGVAVARNRDDLEQAVDSEADVGRFRQYLGGLRRSHLVAVVLVLVGVFIMFGYLSNNRATAQDPAEFEEAEESDWELEQDVEETRWLLERSDSED